MLGQQLAGFITQREAVDDTVECVPSYADFRS